MNDDTASSVVLPLIGTALCAALLGLALGYLASVDEQVFVLDDEAAGGPTANGARSVAFAEQR